MKSSLCRAAIRPLRDCTYMPQALRPSRPISTCSSTSRRCIAPSTSRPALSPSSRRSFTTTSPTQSWLEPRMRHHAKLSPKQKGSPHLRTGGSIKGTTVCFGDYGLRLKSRIQRVPSKILALGVAAIKMKLKNERYRLYNRINVTYPVFTKGNEVRMGKGKGGFDYWAARVSNAQVVFEIKGGGHEQVVRDALRYASTKLPGNWEFVKRGDPPVMGTTKMTQGITLESLQRPRKALPGDVKAGRLPAASPTPLPGIHQGQSTTPPPAAVSTPPS